MTNCNSSMSFSMCDTSILMNLIGQHLATRRYSVRRFCNARVDLSLVHPRSAASRRSITTSRRFRGHFSNSHNAITSLLVIIIDTYNQIPDFVFCIIYICILKAFSFSNALKTRNLWKTVFFLDLLCRIRICSS